MKPRKKINESFNGEKKNNETTNINSTDTASSSVSTANNEPSVITDQSGIAEQGFVRPEDTGEQASILSKDATVQRRGNNDQMVQNVLLIWLDNNTDENSDDYRNSSTQLRQTVYDINTFTDGVECVQFIDKITDTKVCIIISSSFGPIVVPYIHTMSQVDSIFIFSSDKDYHQQWIKEWPKIKGVFAEISSICEALKQATQQCEQNAISISFMATNEDLSKKNLDQLDAMFMHSQILKEILLTIEFGDRYIEKYTNYCRTVFAENDVQLDKVDQLQIEYQTKTPIWWYTWDSFLYPMLNCALRSMNMDIIIKMGFFISDLHRHIEKLHAEQFNGSTSGQIFTVYRGQGMSKIDFDKMKSIEGGLMSFNNFLSTSKNRQISFGFASHALSNVDMVGILFVLTIDPTKSTTPFASVGDVGYYGDKEGEVLFSMHTVFRIGEIISMDGNPRLCQVNLTLTSDNDTDLRILTDRIREESDPDTEGWFRLGSFLLKLGESAKAQQVYETLLEQTTDMSEKAGIYHQLAWAKGTAGEYQEAIKFNEKALEIFKETLSPTDLKLAGCYNNIGVVYEKMGDYPKALSYYEKDLEINQQSFPLNRPHLGSSYNNIGGVYEKMGDYPKALIYHKKALEIKEQSLPSNHPSIGVSYNNLGVIYYNMGDYPKATLSLEKALKIQQQSLPSNHPGLGHSYNNIGGMYEKIGNYPKALSYCEKAIEVKQQLLPSNHPELGICYNNIGIMHFNVGDYPKALSWLEKGLEIKQQSLPSNHPELAKSYSALGLVYNAMRQQVKAIEFYEKVLEIEQQILASNHPDLGSSYNNIGAIYGSMGDYLKALSYFEKALEIKQQSLPSNHSDLGSSYNNIGMVYENIDDFSNALSFYKRAVEIGQQSLPTNHPDLQSWKRNLDRMEKKL